MLDYSCSVKFSEFKNIIQLALKEKNDWKLKDIKNKRNTYFALLLIKDKKLKHNFSLKIEIHKPAKKIKLEKELRIISSPVSSYDPLLLVPTISKLKELKSNALIDRKKARDIFDLWYIAQVLRENFILPAKIPKFSKYEFQNELQVFLPKKYYPTINDLYEKINRKN
jgi:predicted nucleotidyltransferase component of viral defense system